MDTKKGGDMPILDLISDVDELQVGWRTFDQKVLHAIPFDDEFIAASGASITSIRRLMDVLLPMLASINKSDLKEKEYLFSIAPFQSLQANIKKLTDLISDSIRFHLDEHGETREFTYTSPTETLRDDGEAVNLGELMKNIRALVTQMATQLATSSFFVFSQAPPDFSVRAKRFQDLLIEIKPLKKQIKTNATAASTELDAILAARAEAGGQVEELETILESATEMKEKISADKEAIAEKLAEVSALADRFEKLKSEVVAFESDFSIFDEQIESRNTAYERVKNKLDALLTENSSLTNVSREIVDKAEEMLGTATNAALASAFEAKSREFHEETDKARNAFYVAIALLLLSVVPLLTYVVPIPYLDFLPTAGETGVTLGGVISRMVIMFPGVWLATFASIRYTNAFSLRREYAFKAAIAMSVEGFRKQSPSYEQEVAAASFVSLSEKPVLSAKGPAMPNPIMDYVSRKIKKRFDTLASPAPAVESEE